MSYRQMVPIPPAFGPGLGERFAYILHCLRLQLANHGRGPGAIPQPLLVSSHAWLGRTMQRFAALLARYRAGLLTPGLLTPGLLKPRCTDPAAGQSAADPPPDTPPYPPQPPAAAARPAREGVAAMFFLRLPRRPGWLTTAMPVHAAAAGGYLAQLLADPELRDLIATAPNSVGRLLRPLARLLHFNLPPELQRPPRPRQRRQQPPPATQPAHWRPRLRDCLPQARPRPQGATHPLGLPPLLEKPA